MRRGKRDIDPSMLTTEVYLWERLSEPPALNS
jgi:hypothetical protein